jgi:hypothetical protein
LGFADALTQYGTAGRYPDDVEPVAAKEARHAVTLATRVRTLVLRHLKPLLPIPTRPTSRKKPRRR